MVELPEQVAQNHEPSRNALGLAHLKQVSVIVEKTQALLTMLTMVGVSQQPQYPDPETFLVPNSQDVD